MNNDRVSWNLVFEKEGFCTDLNPRPFVKQHMQDCLPDAGPVLDIGCGCGRHLVYLAGLGYDVYGIDTSSVALEQTAEHLRRHGLNAHLAQATMWAIPFERTSFSVALCVNVINHATPEEIKHTISGLAPRLKPSALFLLTTLTPNDYKAKGQRKGQCSFVCDEGPEAGILHTFFDETSIRQLLEPSFVVEQVQVANYKQRSGTGKPLCGEHLWIRARRT
jgi:2-polyprenyl-3-methyl-5-hydroxy-6-metoxy-1,4-benzoquinol methylase